MPTAPKFPSIPVPTAEVHGLHRTALALKQAVEMLTGLDAKSTTGQQANRFATHTFFQPTRPEALNIGDFWVSDDATSTYTFSVWDGTDWLLIAVLPGGGSGGGLFQSPSGFMSMTPADIPLGVYAYTQIGWSASRWNIDNCFDTYTFRPPSAGFWEISFQLGVNWTERSPIEVFSAHQEAHITLNGPAPASTVAVAATAHAVSAGSPIRLTTQVRWAGNLVVGDEISFWALAGSDPATINLTDFYNYAYAFKYANAPLPVSSLLAHTRMRKYFPKPFVKPKVRST